MKACDFLSNNVAVRINYNERKRSSIQFAYNDENVITKSII